MGSSWSRWSPAHDLRDRPAHPPHPRPPLRPPPSCRRTPTSASAARGGNRLSLHGAPRGPARVGAALSVCECRAQASHRYFF
eukprot:4294858-Lingulodinium_polyedra.AAC.1